MEVNVVFVHQVSLWLSTHSFETTPIHQNKKSKSASKAVSVVALDTVLSSMQQGHLSPLLHLKKPKRNQSDADVQIVVNSRTALQKKKLQFRRIHCQNSNPTMRLQN